MRKGIVAGLVLAAASLAPALFAGSASAAHCVSPDGTSPGFSYFGTVHVANAEHAEGGNPGPHAGTSGASNCNETTGSPADRAPGRQ